MIVSNITYFFFNLFSSNNINIISIIYYTLISTHLVNMLYSIYICIRWYLIINYRIHILYFNVIKSQDYIFNIFLYFKQRKFVCIIFNVFSLFHSIQTLSLFLFYFTWITITKMYLNKI